MSYELTLGFHGLCGLVPEPTTGSLAALLVDARSRGTASDGKATFEPHVPCLQYRPDDGWNLGGARPHYEFRSGGRDYALLLLNRTELQFEMTPADPAQRPIAIHRQGPSGEQIACLAEVAGDSAAADVDPRCLGTAPPPTVVARIRLNAGRFGPDVPDGARSADCRFGSLRRPPRQGEGPLVRRMAPASRWDVRLEGGVELTGLDIDDGRSRQWTLSRRDPTDARLWIKNLELGTIVNDTYGCAPGPTVDWDFEQLYELSRQRPAERPVPYLEKINYSDDIGRCMHAFFNDFRG